jgi:cysteine synthase
MSIERRKILAHLGAELELTPGAGGMPAAVARAEDLAKTIPDAVIPGQFENPANPLVHELTTAEEIFNDTGGKVDALVIGVGTGGTLTGCGRVLKKRIPGMKVIAVEPSTSAILSGQPRGPHKIQGIGAGFIPTILQRDLIDEVVTVPSDMAFEVSRMVAHFNRRKRGRCHHRGSAPRNGRQNHRNVRAVIGRALFLERIVPRSCRQNLRFRLK